MRELDLWSEANLTAPLTYTDPNQADWNETVERIKKAVRTKVLDTYHNGQKVRHREGPESA